MTRLSKIIATLTFGLLVSTSNAAILTFSSPMNGATEVPPNASTASGFARIIVDTVLNQMFITLTYQGITGGNPSAAHIHCCTPVGTNVGVAVGFPGFPTTTSGSYSHTFDLLDISIYTSAFVTGFGGGTAAGSAAALIAGMSTNRAYTNIHNTVFPGGEIRGNIVLPEPAMLALFGIALAALATGRRRIVRRR